MLIDGPSRAERKRYAAMERQLPSVASALARSVQSGATLRLAIAEVVDVVEPPVAEDLVTVLASLERGQLMDESLTEWQCRWRNDSLDLLIAACRFGHGQGGDLGGALEGVALALLDRLEVGDEARALSTQARSSAAVLACLPILGATAFTLLDPSVGRVLFATPPGWVCLAVGLMLNLAGARALSMIVRVALR